VRFREQSLVHEVVKRAVADALGRGYVPELQLRATHIGAGQPVTATIPGVLSGGVFASRWQMTGRADYSQAAGTSEEQVAARSALAQSPAESDTATRFTDVADSSGSSSVRPMIALGQFRDTFIIAIDDDGMCIIDQHVAHERVLFERIMQRLTGGRLESQRLLVPLMIELSPAERQALAGRASALEQFGFELEEFGGGTIKVTAVPALLPRDECTTALRALAQDLEGLDRGLELQESLKRIAATMACHAAVKANYPLTAEKMRHILDELRATAYSTVCPHGRPVMLRLTRREIEKNFERK
jgi:DNA mismatch repair protein MutL